MFDARARNIIHRTLAKADIIINGHRPWDIIINDGRFYNYVILKGSLGLGEAYIKGWWDSPAPDQLITRILAQKLDDSFNHNISQL